MYDPYKELIIHANKSSCGLFNMTKKILIVDDYDIVRRGLKRALRQAISDIDIVEATTIGSAINVITQHPDLHIAIIDLMLPGGDGRMLVNQVKKHSPDAKIVMISGRDDIDTVNSCLESGANGFISKANSTEQMIEDIQLYMNGDMDHCREATVKPPPVEQIAPLDQYDLTPREKQIAELVKQGLNNKEISNTIYLSEGTIKNYLSVIYEKLQVNNRTQLLVTLSQAQR